jgi:hypothetical protein
MEYENQLREAGEYTEMEIQEKLSDKQSIDYLLNSEENTAVFSLPKTQEDHYRDNDSHKRIITLATMGGKTFGARAEAIFRQHLNMQKTPESGWDHIKMGKKIEQKSIRKDKNGHFGAYHHVEPKHGWDYLLVVRMEYKSFTTYIIKRESILHFIENISLYKFISVQGKNNGDSYQGYLLKDSIPDNIRLEHYTQINSEQDIIDFIHSDSTNT